MSPVPSPPPEAAPADLRRRCDPASLGFATTAEVEPSDAPAGQEPAEQALKLAAELDGGFNAVVTGPPGTGRRAAVGLISTQRVAKSAPNLALRRHS